jgi:hypothetical protein
MGDSAHFSSQARDELRNWKVARLFCPHISTLRRGSPSALVPSPPLGTRSLLPCCHSKEKLLL